MAAQVSLGFLESKERMVICVVLIPISPFLSFSTDAVPPLLSFSTDAVLRYRLPLKVSGISMNFGAGKLYSLALLAMLFNPLPHASIKPLCGMDDLLRQPLAKLDDGPRVGVAKNFQHHLQLTGIATRYLFQQSDNLRVMRTVSERMRIRSVC